MLRQTKLFLKTEVTIYRESEALHHYVCQFNIDNGNGVTCRTPFDGPLYVASRT